MQKKPLTRSGKTEKSMREDGMFGVDKIWYIRIEPSNLE